MFNCENEDKLIKLIKSKGFSPVLTPRDNIKPLDLLISIDEGIFAWFKNIFRDQLLNHSGDGLQDVLKGDSALVPEESKLSSEISGTKSSKVSVEAGIELAMYFLNVQDSDVSDADRKAALKAALDSMQEVSFTIDGNTIKRGVSWSQIDSYLDGATLRDDLPTFKQLIEKGKVYIITHVLSSDSFTFNEEGTFSTSLEAKLPKIKAMLEGSFKGGVSLGEKSGIKYKGEKQMVFGIEAVRLIAEKKEKKEKKEKDNYRFRIQSEIVGVKGEESFQVDKLELTDDENFFSIL